MDRPKRPYRAQVQSQKILVPNLFGAGVSLEGRAVVATDPSGAGKATLARLCLQAGAVLLSDETVGVGLASGRASLDSSQTRGGRCIREEVGAWRVTPS